MNAYKRLLGVSKKINSNDSDDDKNDKKYTKLTIEKLLKKNKEKLTLNGNPVANNEQQQPQMQYVNNNDQQQEQQQQQPEQIPNLHNVKSKHLNQINNQLEQLNNNKSNVQLSEIEMENINQKIYNLEQDKIKYDDSITAYKGNLTKQQNEFDNITKVYKEDTNELQKKLRLMHIDNTSLTNQMKNHDNAIEDYKNKLNELQLLKDNNDNDKSGKIEKLKKELDESYKIINNNNYEFKNKLMATNLIYMFNINKRTNKSEIFYNILNVKREGDDDDIPSKILPPVRNNLLGASKLTNTLNKLGMDNNRSDKQLGYDKIVKHDLYIKITQAKE